MLWKFSTCSKKQQPYTKLTFILLYYTYIYVHISVLSDILPLLIKPTRSSWQDFVKIINEIHKGITKLRIENSTLRRYTIIDVRQSFSDKQIS